MCCVICKHCVISVFDSILENKINYQAAHCLSISNVQHYPRIHLVFVFFSRLVTKRRSFFMKRFYWFVSSCVAVKLDRYKTLSDERLTKFLPKMGTFIWTFGHWVWSESVEMVFDGFSVSSFWNFFDLSAASESERKMLLSA